MEYPIGGQLRSLRLRHDEERVDASFDQIRVASVAVCRLDVELVAETHQRRLGHVHPPGSFTTIYFYLFKHQRQRAEATYMPVSK